MTVHPLHAGDGYTYLTRQVASGDVTRSAKDPLTAYYQAEGNPPGQWVGSGCADLGVSGEVTEEQMLALFGEGLRPDANEFIAVQMAAGKRYEEALAAARLGRKFYSFANEIPLAKNVQAEYEAFERAHGRRPSVEERRQIKVRVARDMLRAKNPGGPPPSAERVRQFIADELGRTRFPVSGFDLVFSAAKSIKVLWALSGNVPHLTVGVGGRVRRMSGQRVRVEIERAHEMAWRGALEYGEREAAFTRAGANGVAFLNTSGFVATAFTHWDSRAGDPDLHTHVAIANRVLAEDGKWRTLDSRQLFRIAVSMSERYNSLLEQHLVDTIGVRFVDVERSPGKRPVREIDGIPAVWTRGFSRRRAQVESIYDDLVADYVNHHGKTPPRSVQHQLAQQATLTDRPAKPRLRSLAEQVREWTAYAEELAPDLDIESTLQAALYREPEPAQPATPAGSHPHQHAERRPDSTEDVDREAVVGELSLAVVAQAVVARVSEERATWRVYHVRAEAERQLRARMFSSAQARIDAVEDVTRLALDMHSVLLGVDLAKTATIPDPRTPQDPSAAFLPSNLPTPPAVSAAQLRRPVEGDDSWLGVGEVDVPQLLRRRDGASVFRRRGSNLHTSTAILAAEDRLLTAARQHTGPAVPDGLRKAVVSDWEGTRGVALDPGQRALVEQFVSSGSTLAVAIGPPGTGKSTAMAAVRAAWRSIGNRVIGLAPSAVAASVLGAELGVRADTLHSLITSVREGRPVDIRAGDMLLVDEAGMAGTLNLDAILAIAEEHGAVVRLVGDYRQLSAVEAGGVLRLLHHDVGGTELTVMHRFSDPAEVTAILGVRVGDEDAARFYTENNRLVGGTRSVVLDKLYQAWQASVAAGRSAIMIADTNDVARELSDRAQADRRAAGLVDNGSDGDGGGGGRGGVELHDGTVAATGDRVVTRLNQRKLRVLGGADFVKNGDLWDVVRAFGDGRLWVRHVEHGGHKLLPADYVAAFVELGYAATITRSQGVTVDDCYAFCSPQSVREALLVALSRGRHANHAFLDTEEILDPDEPDTLPGDLYYRRRDITPAEKALRAIIAREGAKLSATERLREELDQPHRLDTLIPEYLYGLYVHRSPHAHQLAADWVRTALPDHAEDILTDDAWPSLEHVLHEVHAADEDPAELLRTRAAQRPLEDDPYEAAESVAKVLHHRIVADMPLPPASEHRPDFLPGWVPTPPAPNPGRYIDDGRDPRDLAELDTWLRAQARRINDRIRTLGQRAADTTPAWAHSLGPVPDDPLQREQWIINAGQVAAVRERWPTPPGTHDLLPQAHGERGRANTWVTTYLDEHPPDQAAERAAERAARDRAEQEHRREQWATRAADAARRRHERQVREQHRRQLHDDTAALLRNVWRHEPHAAEDVINGNGFMVFATRLHEADEAGYDIHEVLTEIPLHFVNAPRVHEPALYAAALVDIAVDRLRTGKAQRDADRRAREQEFAQMCDQVADLLREEWDTHPDLTDTLIATTAFTAFVRALDHYVTAGLDPRGLLTAIPAAKLAAPAVRDSGALGVYLLHAVGDRQLRDREQAERDTAERQQQHQQRAGAAAVLRHAWHTHPAAAERVITNPTFRFLAERMHQAQQDGHDVDTILRGLDPDTLTGPRVPNPAGTTTYAFTRALTQPQPTAQSTPQQPEQPGPQPTPRTTQPEPQHTPPDPPTTEPRTTQLTPVPWTERTHGDLSDQQLATRITAQEHATTRLIQQRVTADQRLTQLRHAINTDRGPHLLAVDQRLDQLRQRVTASHEADRIEHQWRTTTQRIGDLAERRTRLELEATTNTRHRHRIDDQITQLQTAEQQARHEAAVLAKQAAHQQQLAGPRTERDQLQHQYTEAEQRLDHDRTQARQRDTDQLHAAERHVADLTRRADTTIKDLADLRMEHDIRQRLDPHTLAREANERDAATTTPALQPGQQPAGQRQLDNPLEPTPANAPAQEPPAPPEPDMPERAR